MVDRRRKSDVMRSCAYFASCWRVVKPFSAALKAAVEQWKTSNKSLGQGIFVANKFARAPPAFGLREGKGQSAPAGGGAKGSVRALVESAFGVGKGGPIGMIDPLGLGSA